MKNACVAAIALFSSVACLSAEPIYLKCPIQDRPASPGYDWIIDKDKKTITHLIAGDKNVMPMEVSDLEYAHTSYFNGKLTLEVRINRHTLEFSVYTIGFGPDGLRVRGVCKVVEKQI